MLLLSFLNRFRRFLARALPENDAFFHIGMYGVDNTRAISDLEYLQEQIRELTKRDIKINAVGTLGEWRLNVRMAEKFRVERVFLVGGTTGPSYAKLPRAHIYH
jgi:hypothetical protein